MHSYEPVDANEIFKIKKELGYHLSPGYDNITTKFAKDNINFFAMFLSSKMIEILEYFPTHLKYYSLYIHR